MKMATGFLLFTIILINKLLIYLVLKKFRRYNSIKGVKFKLQ